VSALSAVLEVILLLVFVLILIYFLDPSLLRSIMPHVGGPLYTPMESLFKYPADYIGQPNTTTSGQLISGKDVSTPNMTPNLANATYVLTDGQGDYMWLRSQHGSVTMPNLTSNVQWMYGHNYTVTGVFWQEPDQPRANGCIEVYQGYTQTLDCKTTDYYFIVQNATLVS
jgi:hypothetical protein